MLSESIWRHIHAFLPHSLSSSCWCLWRTWRWVSFRSFFTAETIVAFPWRSSIMLLQVWKKLVFIYLIPSSAFHQTVEQESFFWVFSPGCFTPLITCKLLFAFIDLRFSLGERDFILTITEYYSDITDTPGRTSTDRNLAETPFDSIITSQELKRHAP